MQRIAVIDFFQHFFTQVQTLKLLLYFWGPQQAVGGKIGPV